MTCKNCGADIAASMQACEYCGTENEHYRPPVPSPAVPPVPPAQTAASRPVENSHIPQQVSYQPPVKKTRTGMVIASAILCFFAILYLLLALFIEKAMVAAAVCFGFPGIMFMILSKSPRSEKSQPTYNGTRQGISKALFVFLCLLLTLIVLIISSVAIAPGISSNSI